MLTSPDVLTTVDRLAEAFGDGGSQHHQARYEVFLRASGVEGALVDATPATALPFVLAVARLGNRHQRPLLHAVLARVPARRCVLKTSTDGAVSLFQAIDVPVGCLPRLAEPFGRRSAAERIRDAVVGAGQHVCGWAVEVPPSGAPVRVRFYAMARTAGRPGAVERLAQRLGQDGATREAITRCWQRFAEVHDVVVNIQAEDHISLKLEFPAVRVPDAVAYSGSPGWCDAVERAAARLGCGTLTHLGVRWQPSHREELCAYLPAAPPLLGSGNGKGVHP